jgi:hypothetical protein
MVGRWTLSKRRGGEDFVSWPQDRLGLFTVKSAYNQSDRYKLLARWKLFSTDFESCLFNFG